MFNALSSLLHSTKARRRAPRLAPPALERLEDRLLLSVTGSIDSIGSAAISGWFIAPANVAAPVHYHVDVNGVVGATQAASNFRGDLAAAFGNGNHGFSLSGNYTNKTLDIFTIDPVSGATTLFYSNNRPVAGSVDALTSSIVAGWAFDPDLASAPAQVRIDVDGVVGSVVNANQSRTDLAAVFGSPNHGFSLDVGKLTTGNHTVSVWAIDPGSTTSAPVLLAQRTVTKAGPVGFAEAITSTAISGWAYSPDDGPDSVFIDVNINGIATDTVTANNERGDLGGVLGSTFHGFSIVPTINPGANLVQVFARDSAGNRTLIAQQTVVDHAPFGNIDQATGSMISGWMIDQDAPSTSISYRLDIDGVAGTVLPANNTRSDLAPVFGSPNHGFAISGSFAGHTVELYALDAISSAAVLLYSNNHTPIANVDSINASAISGWAFDPDNGAATVNIRVDVDGAVGTPVAATNPRGDLVSFTGGFANHGYSIPLNLDPGTHTVKVYALDGTADGAAPILMTTATLTNRPPVGTIDILSDATISGWAFDPDSASPITATLYINKVEFATVTANDNRPDLAGPLGSPLRGFHFDTSSLPAGGSRQVTLTIHDSSGGAHNQVNLFDAFVNNHPPIGSLDFINNTTVSGWAYDQDAGSAPIDVDFYVDGVFAATTTANQNRPDLTAPFGSPLHGFTMNLPALGFGPHKIEMFAVESFNTASVKVAQATLTNFRPVGGLLSLNASTITGWAYDADIPSAALNVQLVVSNIVIGTYVANVSNSTVNNYYNSPNHAFSIAMPTLSTGTYEVNVYALDPNNGLRTAIISTFITV